MKDTLGGAARRLKDRSRDQLPSRRRLVAELKRLSGENERMREEIDELRHDSRRIAELYDLVFDRLNEAASSRPAEISAANGDPAARR